MYLFVKQILHNLIEIIKLRFWTNRKIKKIDKRYKMLIEQTGQPHKN